MLPLADEIRALRVEAGTAEEASKQLVHLSGAILTLEILETQVRSRGIADMPFPGVELLTGIAATFPQVPPPVVPEGPLLDRLAHVLTLLRDAVTTLRPIAGRHHELAGRLHRLVHEQQDLLADPAHASQLAALQDLTQRRDAIGIALGPMQTIQLRTNAIVPRLTEYAQAIEGHLEWARSDPAARPALVQTATQTATIYVDTIAALCEGAHVDVPPPTVVRPVGTERDDVLRAVAETAQGLRRFAADLGPAITRRTEEIARLSAEYAALQAQIRELTG